MSLNVRLVEEVRRWGGGGGGLKGRYIILLALGVPLPGFFVVVRGVDASSSFCPNSPWIQTCPISMMDILQQLHLCKPRFSDPHLG